MLNWKATGCTRGIEADSQSWTDDGSPLPYQICYDPEDGWLAIFEGQTFATGTLQECCQACETADLDGKFEPPNPLGERVIFAFRVLDRYNLHVHARNAVGFMPVYDSIDALCNDHGNDCPSGTFVP